MTATTVQTHLDVDPSLVFHLGDTLISDEVQAIVELVKNSYDADATWANVVVDTDAVTTEETSFFPGCKGQVVVEDDGTGMDAEDIDRGWLTLANSPKRQAKRLGYATPKFKRTPLGDKGLGRLGVQRLGYVVELLTRKTRIHELPGGDGAPRFKEEADADVYHVGIDWREFTNYHSLQQVPVESRVLPTQVLRRGTRITVAQLRDPDAWTGQAVTELQRKLSQVIFPFGKVRPFRVYASVNGEALDLLQISEQLRDAATSRYRFRYADGQLTVDGRYKLTAFRPPYARDQSQYQALLVRDRGRGFYDQIQKDRSAVSRTGVEYTTEDPWFLTTHTTMHLDRLGDVQLSGDVVADPGSFEGEIDMFDLGREAVRGLGGDVFSGFNETVKTHSGVRVFRGGFAIRPYGIDGDDWLKLGSAWTAGSSFYGLRPRNIIGFVSMTAANNERLAEKTDREGFVDSPYSRNFFRLMREVTDAINRALDVLNRRYNAYRDLREREGIGAGIETTPDVLFNRIRATAQEATHLRAAVAQLERTMDQTRRTATAVAIGDPGDRSTDVQTLLTELDTVLQTGRQSIAQIQEYTQRAAVLGGNADVLERDLTKVRDQLQQFSELAALGLTAEAVSHEMRTVAGNLALRTRAVLAHLRKHKIADAELVAYTEHVRSAVSALRKQLSHLAPALRYVREHMDILSLRPFVTDLQEFHAPGFARLGIGITLEEPFGDFSVRMNRGKLTQVLDNLFYNARYWLRHDLEARRISEASIFIRSSSPSLLIWDTGRGIDTAIEDSIFEPFVTNKPKGQGRGLGLFIARQLLESSGCSIELLNERNRFGSRYLFEVNLAGAIHGGG